MPTIVVVDSKVNFSFVTARLQGEKLQPPFRHLRFSALRLLRIPDVDALEKAYWALQQRRVCLTVQSIKDRVDGPRDRGPTAGEVCADSPKIRTCHTNCVLSCLR